MIVVDTNVLSELMRPSPAATVLGWAQRHDLQALHATSIARAEILVGIALLPLGKRRNELAAASDRLFGLEFSGRILPFDSEAASAFAEITASRARAGRPIMPLDALIAAIARKHGAAIATRNVADFADCGVALIDPWTA